MIKSKFIFLILYSLSFVFYTSPTFAHTVKSEGSIGAVLHIDPGDSPIANDPSHIFIEFKDKENNFSLDKCSCQLFIYQNNQLISQQSLEKSGTDALSAVVNFEFPSSGIYKLEVNGRPLDGSDFKNFTFGYDIRVEASSNIVATKPNWFSQHLVHLIGGFAVLGFFIFALIKQSIDQKKKGGVIKN